MATNIAKRSSTTTSITIGAWYQGSPNAYSAEFVRVGGSKFGTDYAHPIGSGNWTTSDFTCTGLQPNTTYQFYVNFFGFSGNKLADTGLVSYTTDAVVLPNPTTPSSVSVSSITKDSAYASWGSSSYADMYEYQFLENGSIIVGHGYTDVRYAYSPTLIGGTNYTFRVRGVNSNGSSSWATRDFTTTQPIPPPNAPSSVSVSSITHDSATISASSVSGATRYNLVVLLSGGYEHTESSSTSRVFYVTGLSPNVTYTYGVSAENSNGTSSVRWATSFNTLSLQTPSLSVSNPTMTSLNLTVSGGTSGLYGYYYSRREWYPSTSSWSGWTQMYFSYGTSVTATGLSANTTYGFKVYGITDGGAKTPESGIVTGSTSGVPSPTVTFGTKTTSSAIVNIVTSVTATSYGLQRRDNIVYTWIDVSSASKSTTVTGLINGRSYDFRARVYFNGAWSAWGSANTVDIGSPRPQDWVWEFTIDSGSPFYNQSSDGKTAYLMRAVHWNGFTDRIKLFRMYKTPTSIPTFTQATTSTTVSGILSCINQAITAINAMGFSQSTLSTLDGLRASVFTTMRDNLNSVT